MFAKFLILSRDLSVKDAFHKIKDFSDLIGYLYIIGVNKYGNWNKILITACGSIN